MPESPVDRALQALIRALNGVATPHVFVGAVAIRSFGVNQSPETIEFCAAERELARFRGEVAGREFDFLPGAALRSYHPQTQTLILAHVAGDAVGGRRMGPAIRWPSADEAVVHGNLAVAPLHRLIEALLATQLDEDRDAVAALIAAQRLDVGFAQRVHPIVRGEFAAFFG